MTFWPSQTSSELPVADGLLHKPQVMNYLCVLVFDLYGVWSPQERDSDNQKVSEGSWFLPHMRMRSKG